ncbi:hypothetical protein G6F68_016894 [Rhizopus microsporus]|nr:hypothetical protein G6F68_016894 [Rhizopus microsporus]
MPEGLARHRCSAAGDKQRIALAPCRELGPGGLQILVDPMRRLGTQRHQAIFAALAQHHAHHAFVQADIQRAHAHQFRHAQAGGVQRFQHGPVTQAARLAQIGRAQQGVHLLFGQGLGQARRLLGGDERQAGIPFGAMFTQGPGGSMSAFCASFRELAGPAGSAWACAASP